MRILLPFLLLLVLQDKEEGFEKLFNGKDLDGWRFVLSKKDADPAETFRVKDGVIVCSGRPSGFMVTKSRYREFTLRLEWRYKRPEGLKDDAEFRGNSGYLLFVQEDEIWPRSIEVQGMNRDVGGIIPIKTRAKFETDAEARRKAVKPVGQWNSMEIVVRKGEIRVYVNDAKISTVTMYEPKEGPIAFQSEGAEIHWKNVRIRPEKE